MSTFRQVLEAVYAKGINFHLLGFYLIVVQAVAPPTVIIASPMVGTVDVIGLWTYVLAVFLPVL